MPSFSPSRTGLERLMPSARPEWISAMARLSQVLVPHYGMDRLEWVHFIGQIGHETNGLSLGSMRENMNYSAKRMKEIFRYRLMKALKENTLNVRDDYGTLDNLCRGLVGQPEKLTALVYGGREGTPVGCGKYCGRGPTQITHLDNYRAIGREIAKQPGGEAVDLVANPELLEQPEWGVRSAFADWAIKDLRKLALVDDVDRVSAKLNTGSPNKVSITNGLESRRRWVAKAKGVWPAVSDREVERTTMLKEGDRGPEIEALQRRLNDLGYPVGSIDGVFGLLTTRAVRNFQAEHGLVVDGRVGPRTADVLASSAPADLGERSTVTAEDLAERGSVTVTDGQRVAASGKWAGAMAGAGSAVAVGNEVLGVVGQARSISDQASDALRWLISPGGLAVIGLAIAALVLWRLSVWGNRIVEARVRDARAGVHLGR